MKSNVITIPKDNWNTLILLKSSIKHFKERENSLKYKTTIDKEQRMFNEILNESVH